MKKKLLQKSLPILSLALISFFSPSVWAEDGDTPDSTPAFEAGDNYELVIAGTTDNLPENATYIKTIAKYELQADGSYASVSYDVYAYYTTTDGDGEVVKSYDGYVDGNSTSANIGGALTNEEETAYNADFINNSATTTNTTNNVFTGGAIYNDSTMSVDGDFVGNYISNAAGSGNAATKTKGASGGAIYNNTSAIITSLSGDFLANYAYSYSWSAKNNANTNNNPSTATSSGGAIYNLGEIGTIEGSFNSNYTNASAYTGYGTHTKTAYSYGGAIYNNTSAEITSIVGDFLANYAYAQTAAASTGTNKTEAQGGAIYNKGTISSVEGNFIDNYVYSNYSSSNSSASTTTQGGAVYNAGDITFKASDEEDAESVEGGSSYSYTGNWAGVTEETRSDANGGFLYQEEGGSATFDIDEYSSITIGEVYVDTDVDADVDLLSDSDLGSDNTVLNDKEAYDSIAGYGTITKTGEGSLTVNSSMEYYEGALNVEEGTMSYTNSAELGAESLTIGLDTTSESTVGTLATFETSLNSLGDTETTVNADGLIKLLGGSDAESVVALNASISGAGSTELSGYVSSEISISTYTLSIVDGANLSISADNLDSSIVKNAGTLSLSAGETSAAISGEGTTEITGAVIANSSISSSTLNILSDSSLSISATNLASATTIEETGTLSLSAGETSAAISGAGKTEITGTVITSSSISSATLSILSDSSLSIDADKISSSSISNEGTINLTGGTSTDSSLLGTTLNGNVSIATSAYVSTVASYLGNGDITNAGTLTLTEATLDSSTLLNTGTLNTDATYLGLTTSITNDGTINLTGGTLENAINTDGSKTGTLSATSSTISAAVFANSVALTDSTVSASVSADNIDIAGIVRVDSAGSLVSAGTIDVATEAELKSSVASLIAGIVTDGTLSLSSGTVSDTLADSTLVITSGESGKGSLSVEGTISGNLTVNANANKEGLTSIDIDAVTGTTSITGDSDTTVVLGDANTKSDIVTVNTAKSVNITNAGTVTLTNVASTIVNAASKVEMSDAGIQSSVELNDVSDLYVGESGLSSTGKITINGDSDGSSSVTNIYSADNALVAGNIYATASDIDASTVIIDLANIGTVGNVSATSGKISIDNATLVGSVSAQNGEVVITGIKTITGSVSGVGSVSITGVIEGETNITTIQNVTVTGGKTASLILTNIYSAANLSSEGSITLNNVDYVANIYVDGNLTITGKDTVISGVIESASLGSLDVGDVGGNFVVSGDVDNNINITNELYDSITVKGSVLNSENNANAIYVETMTDRESSGSIYVGKDVGTEAENNGNITIANANGGSLEVEGTVYGNVNIGTSGNEIGIDSVSLATVAGDTTIYGDADTTVSLGNASATSGNVTIDTAASVDISGKTGSVLIGNVGTVKGEIDSSSTVVILGASQANTDLQASVSGVEVGLANVDVNSSVSAGNIEIAGTVLVGNKGSLTSTDTISVGSSANLTASLENLSANELANEGTLNLAGGKSETVELNFAITGEGDVNVSGNITVGEDASIAGSTLTVTEDASLTTDAGNLDVDYISNTGTLNLSGDEDEGSILSASINASVDADGEVTFDNVGTITITGTVVAGADVYIGAEYLSIGEGSSLDINTSNLSFESILSDGDLSLDGDVDTDISGSGSVDFSSDGTEQSSVSSKVDISGDISISGNVAVEGSGSLSAGENILVNEESTLTSNADNLSADKGISNKGDLVLTGGTLSSQVNDKDNVAGDVVVKDTTEASVDVYSDKFSVEANNSYTQADGESVAVYANEYVLENGAEINVTTLSNVHDDSKSGIKFSTTGDVSIRGDIIANSNIDYTLADTAEGSYTLYGSTISTNASEDGVENSVLTIDSGVTLVLSSNADGDMANFKDVGLIVNNGTIDLDGYSEKTGESFTLVDDDTIKNNGGIEKLYGILNLNEDDLLIDTSEDGLTFSYMAGDYLSTEVAENANEKALAELLEDVDSSTGDYIADASSSTIKLNAAESGLDSYIMSNYSHIAEVNTMLISNMNMANVNRARGILNNLANSLKYAEEESEEASAYLQGQTKETDETYSNFAQLQSINLLGSKKGNNGVAGYDYWSVGSTANIDKSFSENTIVGLSLGGVYNKVSGDAGDSANSTAFLLNAYAVAKSGIYPFEIFANLGYAHFWNTGSKAGAKADWDSDAFNALGGIAFDIETGLEGFSIKPIAMFNFALLNSDSASYSNGVDIEAQNYISAKITAGMELEYAFSTQFNAVIRAMYAYEVGDESYDYTYGISSVLNGVNYVGSQAGRNSAIVGLGLSYDFSETCSAYFDYNAYIYQSLITHSLNFTLGLKF